MRAHLCLRSLWNHRKSNEQVKISKCHKRNKNHCLYKTWWWWYHKRENEKKMNRTHLSHGQRDFLKFYDTANFCKCFFFIKTRQFYVTTWLLNFHCSYVPQSSFRPSQNSYCFLYENIMHIKINFPQQKNLQVHPAV